MRIAITSSNGKHIDTHFGHAEKFYIYEVQDDEIIFIEIRATKRFCTKDSNHGKNDNGIERFANMLSDCEILLCSSIGYYVSESLKEYGIIAYMLECDIMTGLKASREKMLEHIMLV